MELDILVGGVALGHLIAAPYTKVEESFNLQACHDIMYNGLFLNEYDHLEYPGVVPRTFLGALAVSITSLPMVLLSRLFGLPKFVSQYLIRAVLGFFVILAWRRLRIQIEKAFGDSMSRWFSIMTATQFHFLYYLSRPLPNTFALIFALLAFSYWLEQDHRKQILCSGIAVVIFRAELVLLLGPMLLIDIYSKRLQIILFLQYIIPAGILCLSATILVDSVFWGRLLWPEGEVLWFNTYQNQSHHWGTYPLLWYWYSALPRALGLSLVLVPVGIIIDPRIRTLVLPAFIFITLYSFLPHKELRFIMYIFPLLNVAASRACAFFWTSRHKSTMRMLLAVGAALHFIVNIGFTCLLLVISSNNYPGGAVMLQLHDVLPSNESVSVHIDNYAAQTGVSRFTQLNPQWRYDKTENLKAGSPEIRKFSHLLVEAKSKYAYNLKHYQSSHEVVGSIDAFSHLSFNYQSFPPLKIRVKPSIFILKNLIKEDIDWSWLDGQLIEEDYNDIADEGISTEFSEILETDDSHINLDGSELEAAVLDEVEVLDESQTDELLEESNSYDEYIESDTLNEDIDDTSDDDVITETEEEVVNNIEIENESELEPEAEV